jgi:transcriptional regulator with XRE-family HTH domain
MVIVTPERRRSPSAPSVKVNGPAIRFVREVAGITVTELAAAAGVSVGFLARVERGEKPGLSREVFERVVYRLRLGDPRVVLADPYAIRVNIARNTASSLTPSIAPSIISGSTRAA